MTRLPVVLLTVVLFLAVLAIFLLREVSHAEARLGVLEPRLAALEARPAESFHLGLGEVMGYQQRWIDKVGLAVQAGNWDAAVFYAGELKETADDLIAARVVRDQQDVSALVKSALAPAIDGLTEAVANKDKGLFVARYDSLVATCNACHATAKVPFIRVTTAGAGAARWNQNFAPAAAGR